MAGPIAVDEEQIKQIAYDLWEREGRPRGRELDHYFRAQQLVTRKYFDPAVSSIVEPEPAQPAISQTIGTPIPESASKSHAGVGAKPAKRSTAKKAVTKPRSKRG